ncbi:MAG TPA: hypothetical protein VFJ83_08470 [Nocardioidaceae bacterium]|nr:hypothetical protein [Nocardioidaceae bacterium]
MSVTRPRGPLPARVYWTRRLLVLGVAFALVFGIGRLLGGGPDTTSDQSASPAAATVESPTATPTPSALSTSEAQPVGEEKVAKKAKVRTPLPMPSGPCLDSDVRVVPAMQGNAFAGEDVRLTLELSTFESPACDWEVSAEAIAVKLTSGSDRIWTSQECPSAVPEEAVVLRQRQTTLVDVVWSGRRSDSDCSQLTQWAEPGYYHVSAAAMGSEPESQQFKLLAPAPVTITPTPTPRPGERADEKGRRAAQQKSRNGNGERGSAED